MITLIAIHRRNIDAALILQGYTVDGIPLVYNIIIRTPLKCGHLDPLTRTPCMILATQNGVQNYP